MFKGKKLVVIISALIVILIAVLLYLSSSQSIKDSSKLSKNVATLVISVIHKIKPEFIISISSLENIVRKGAHLILYFFLGYFMYLLINYKIKSCLLAVVIALLVCLLYGISDEVHQLFVARGAQFQDIAIDFIGSALGIFIGGLQRYYKGYPKKQ